MKKLYLPLTIVLISFIIFSQFCFAQIPYAAKQPKWHFPIYAEDATGLRDTAYLGHDPNAYFCCGDDPIYGELWKKGKDNFSVTTQIGNNDSIIKVDIRDSGHFENFYFDVYFISATYPLKLKFDLTKLSSDSLPFPDQYPFPRCQIEINYGSGSQAVAYPECWSPILIATDTIDSNNCICCTRDSIVLVDIFNNPNPQVTYLAFSFHPWTGITPTGVGIKEFINPNPNYYPNPVSEVLIIRNSLSEKRNIDIYNSLGILVLRISSYQNEINVDLKNIPPGVYFLRLNGPNSGNSINKILKYETIPCFSFLPHC